MQIGIVGAGLCGLAAAAFLARKGHGVTVLERAVMPRPVGAGLLLQPPGMAILQRLGVRDALVAGGARITRLDSRTSDGRVLLDLRYADLAPGLHGLGLGRPAIWSALHGAASAAGARILSACEVRHVTALSDAALAQMANGTQQEFDLLVVAAGAHARFWQARPGHLARLYPWGCLWATISLPPDWPKDVLQQRCVGTQVMVGILPTGPVGARAKAALYWSVRNDQVPALRQRPIDLWHNAAARAWPEIEPLVRHLEHGDLEHATYRDVWAAPPYDRRVVLVGDAAHGTSPQLGQGTTQALRDAEALAEALSGPGDLAAQLAAYWQARRRRTAYYRLASRALTPAFQSGIPGLGWLRDRLAGPIGRWSPVRNQALLTLAGLKDGLFSSDAL